MTDEGVMTETKKRKFFLNWSEQDHQIIVTPEDENRFVLTVGQAIRACHARVQENEFKAQYVLMLQELASWIRENETKVGEAFLTVRDAGLLFLVIRKEVEYDDDFEDSLSDLDIQIAQDPHLDQIRLSVLALPACSTHATEAFLNPSMVSSFRRSGY